MRFGSLQKHNDNDEHYKKVQEVNIQNLNITNAEFFSDVGDHNGNSISTTQQRNCFSCSDITGHRRIHSNPTENTVIWTDTCRSRHSYRKYFLNSPYCQVQHSTNQSINEDPHCLPAWDPIKFSDCLNGKTLHIWGDSLSEQMYDSLICMLSQKFMLVKSKTAVWMASAPWKSMASQKVEFPLFAPCEQFIGTKFTICFAYLLRGLGKKLEERISRMRGTDILLMNFGMHYNYNSESMKSLYADSLRLSKLVKKSNVTFIWRETSLQHFSTQSGNFDKRVKADGKFSGCRGVTAKNFVASNSRNIHSCNHFKGFHVLPTASQTFHDNLKHAGPRGSKLDCTHFCFLPDSPPFHWNRLLLQILQTM